MRVTPSLSRADGADVQARSPAFPIGLSRVGVTGVEKVVRIRDELFFARLECFVDLGRDQKGAHMSRFEEVVNEAIGEVVLTESPFRAETLARDIARLVRDRQGAARAEVTVATPSTSRLRSPVSPRRRSTRSTGARSRWRAAPATSLESRPPG
jgi:GTP cyclohydrolase-4